MMANTVVLEEGLEIPAVRSLAEFRGWATSDRFPETGRIDYLGGRIEVDMTPEDLYTHGKLKTRLAATLDQLVETADLGDVFVDGARVSSPEADLSCEPDIMFVSNQALESGRVRLIPKVSGQPDRYIELEGAPDLVVEIVSDRSVDKDTRRLPKDYWRVGIPQYWLTDARGPDFVFQIYRHGPDGYEPAPSDPERFQFSAVLSTWFRVTRRRHRSGRWTYQVETRSSGVETR